MSRWLVEDGKWGNRMRNSLECDVSALHTPYHSSLSLSLSLLSRRVLTGSGSKSGDDETDREETKTEDRK